MERVVEDGEDKGATKHKSVRWKSDVSVMKSAMVKDLDTMSVIVGHSEEVGVSDQSALPALLFKMTSTTDY